MYTAIECGQRENLYISMVLVHIIIYTDVVNINLPSSNNILATNACLFVTFKI